MHLLSPLPLPSFPCLPLSNCRSSSVLATSSTTTLLFPTTAIGHSLQRRSCSPPQPSDTLYDDTPVPHHSHRTFSPTTLAFPAAVLQDSLQPGRGGAALRDGRHAPLSGRGAPTDPRHEVPWQLELPEVSSGLGCGPDLPRGASAPPRVRLRTLTLTLTLALALALSCTRAHAQSTAPPNVHVPAEAPVVPGRGAAAILAGKRCSRSGPRGSSPRRRRS